MKRSLVCLLLLPVLAGCGGSSGDDTAAADSASKAPAESPSAGPPLCSTIAVGASANVAMLESGCSDPDRNTIVVLNHTKCRSGSDFGTFDLKDASGTTDQLFAYQGTWHSTKAEVALYKKAFAECL